MNSRQDARHDALVVAEQEDAQGDKDAGEVSAGIMSPAVIV